MSKKYFLPSSRIEQLLVPFDTAQKIRILDSGSHHKINWHSKKILQFLFQPEIGVGITVGFERLKLDKKIQVTRLRIESAGDGRSKKLKPPNPIFGAKLRELEAMLVN